MAHPDRPAKSPHLAGPRLAGVVIAGGRSRRFGGEKAAALFAGRPLLHWAVQALAGRCDAVAVNAPPDSAAAAMARTGGHAALSDDPGHPSGPLAGLAAGLAWAKGQGFAWLATLPCDTPLLTSVHIAALGTPPDGAGAAFAATAQGPQPLCAVWRTDIAATLAERLADGRHPSVRAFLAEIGAAPVFFADEALFADADTPEALAALEALRRTGEPA